MGGSGVFYVFTSLLVNMQTRRRELAFELVDSGGPHRRRPATNLFNDWLSLKQDRQRGCALVRSVCMNTPSTALLCPVRHVNRDTFRERALPQA
jgi:hypothetical protein